MFVLDVSTTSYYKNPMADSEDVQPSSIRIPLDLKADVIRRAVAEGRTFSQHVVWLLRKHVESTPEPRATKTSKARNP